MESIKIDITILAPVQKVWDFYKEPKHIVKWNFSNSFWHCPKAVNNLINGGNFDYRMEAKNKSFGYDYKGTYDEVIPNELIKFKFNDGRLVEVKFQEIDSGTTRVFIEFEPETRNTREMQREGWYAILNNFHKYVEKH